MKRIWGWLMELRFLWFALIVVVGTTIILPMLLGQSLTLEQRIRIAGLLLQLLGIVVVVYSMRDFFRQWRKRYPGFRRQVIEHVTIEPTNITDSWHTSVTVPIDSNATTESRINTLEKNLCLMRQQIENIERDMDQKFQKVLGALEQEKQARDRDYQDFRFEWEKKEKCNLRISLMGVVWLFVGVILSTISSELARFFS